MKRLHVLAMILFVAFVTSSFAARVEGDVKKSFDVGAGGWLTLEADLGSVEVKTHGSGTVEVEVLFDARRSLSGRELRDVLDELDLDITQRGKDVEIHLDCERGNRGIWDSVGRYLRVRFLISVPEEYNVNLTTSGGGIEVEDLKGEVLARTSGGSLQFGHIQGPLNGRTSGGSITLDGCDSNAEVRTSGGSITLGRVKGDVYAKTSGGSVTVEEVMGSIEATTSGGSMRATISQQPRHDCRLTTSGGSITVYMAKGTSVNVDASTSGGRVVTEFPVMVRGEISKTSLRAKVNDGGPLLYLHTSGGSIYIKEL